MGGGGGDAGLSLRSSASQFGTFLPRRSLQDDAHFDITAMIDLVFMMNIFFLVTSLTKSAAEVELPQAQYCTPANEVDCVVILVHNSNASDVPKVSVMEETGAVEVAPAELDDRIRTLVERGVSEKKTKVLVKAESKVPIGHIVRITSLATAVEGVEPLFAVVELERKER